MKNFELKKKKETSTAAEREKICGSWGLVLAVVGNKPKPRATPRPALKFFKIISKYISIDRYLLLNIIKNHESIQIKNKKERENIIINYQNLIDIFCNSFFSFCLWLPSALPFSISSIPRTTVPWLHI